MPSSAAAQVLSDYDCDTCTFDIRSAWRRSEGISSGCQTEPVPSTDQQCQAIDAKHAATQTDAAMKAAVTSVSPQQLADFLSEAAPRVERALVAGAASSVAIGEMIEEQASHAARPGCQQLHSLSHQSSLAQPPSVTFATFSASGGSLVVGFGTVTHSDWCSHSSFIAVWNLLRRQLNPDSADHIVEMPACVSALTAHPSNPSIVAVGLYNGEVRVEDLSVSDGDDGTLFAAPIEDLHHRDSIAAIHWLSDTTFLASSADGKVLTWALDSAGAGQRPHPVRGLLLAPSSHYHGRGAVANKHTSLGHSSLALSSDHLTFAAATIGGGLVKGLLAASKPSIASATVKSGEFRWTREAYALIDECEIANKFEAKTAIEKFATSRGIATIEVSTVFESRVSPSLLYRDAAIFSYMGHAGPVSCLAYSPFTTALFASCSYDGSVRLWRMNEGESVLSLHPNTSDTYGCYLYSVSWSPARPCVLACSDSRGFVHVFDLTVDALAPTLVIDHSDSGPCAQIAFNHKEPTMLAGAALNGRCLVWELSEAFAAAKPGELALLTALARPK